MKKTTLLISALLIFTSITYSQKKWTIEFTGGYTMPVADLRGDFPGSDSNGIDFTKSNSLLTKKGFGGSARVKLVVDTTGSARVALGLNYNSFTGEAEYSKNHFNTYKNHVGIFTFSAGVEYAINPKNKIVPFFGLDIGINIFSGKIEGSGDTNFVLHRKTETRFGLIAAGGVEMKIGKSTGVMLGVRYSLTNLMGKNTTTATTIPTNTDVEQNGSSSSYQLPLDDKETSSNPEKILNYVQFYAGFTFNIGKSINPKKK